MAQIVTLAIIQILPPVLSINFRFNWPATLCGRKKSASNDPKYQENRHLTTPHPPQGVKKSMLSPTEHPHSQKSKDQKTLFERTKFVIG